MFIIPCKYAAGNSHHKHPVSRIVPLVESIAKFHPNEKVMVADSNSPDLSYVETIQHSNPNVVMRYNNNHFIDSAVWTGFFDFPDEKFFYVIHDNVEIHKSLEPFRQFEFTSFMTFPLHYGDESLRLHAQSVIAKTKFKYNEQVPGLAGIQFLCNRSVLQKLYERGLHLNTPDNKIESDNSERIWAICLADIGIDITKSSIYGPMTAFNPPFKSEYLTKYLSSRP
jgi:hypothetical protein